MGSQRNVGPRKRIVVYCQHLSGVGHFVRSREIVRALSRHHEVWFVVGGAPVPSVALCDSVHVVQLSSIRRTPEGIIPCDSGTTLAEVFAERRQDLLELLRQVQPEVLMIEHFPFSKWVMRGELTAALETARAVNPKLKVLCSVRDYPAGHEIVGRISEFWGEVVDTLNQSFDALLVHADPQVVRLESQFSSVSDIAIPILYTGFVCQAIEPVSQGAGPDSETPLENCVLVSSGGLGDSERLAMISSAAWRKLHLQNATGGRHMVVITGLQVTPAQYEALEKSLLDGPFLLKRFSGDFLPWMQTAALSISQGGYNTTMNVLQTRTSAILAPNHRMTDQLCRSRLLAEQGLVDMIDPESISVDELADRIQSALSRPMPAHTFALDGAERTCDIITALD